MRDVEDPQPSICRQASARIEVNGSSQARDELQRAATCASARWVPVLIIRVSSASGHCVAEHQFWRGRSDGSYHTLYDTYEHYTGFRGPWLTYNVTGVVAEATMRLANAPRLPLNLSVWPTTSACI